ncbi:MAG: hypothetical protein COB02_08325 [Candidatus Cloacimonadota bacterium]|nr:MAG: hypothetical protein COB02_08325 [Candidatus Cloacimonadota bacterium]
MRLPIAYTPINCLLIILMILSPWIGKKTKEHLQNKHQSQQIEKIKKTFVAKVKIKKFPAKKKRLAKVKIKPSIIQKKEINPVKEKELLLGEARVIELNQRSTESYQQSKKLAVVKIEKPLSTPKTKKHYMAKIRTYAINKDYLSAESVFLEMLETQDISLSPLESLDKLGQFKNKFEKLSNSLSKN